jgi:hypothetical protein
MEEDEAPERDHEPPVREGFLRRWGLGFDADLEFAHERQGDETANELTLDEVGIRAAREWWEAETSIKYQSEGRGLVVEEGSLKLGATETLPWFSIAGRTGLPFGESETRFGEDPIAVALGEQFEDTLILGFDNDEWEIAAGAFRTELSLHDVGVSMSARFAGGSPWAVGVSWTSELGEAAEVRELRRERADELILSGPPRDSVAGLGAAASFDVERGAAMLEVVAALEDFEAGVLEPAAGRPVAWNAETSFRLAPRWEITARFEASDDLPESPARQAGIAAAYVLSEIIRISAEYLRGDFRGEVPDLDLIGAKVAFEY